jgi:hypothetical protein
VLSAKTARSNQPLKPLLPSSAEPQSARSASETKLSRRSVEIEDRGLAVCLV